MPLLGLVAAIGLRLVRTLAELDRRAPFSRRRNWTLASLAMFLGYLLMANTFDALGAQFANMLLFLVLGATFAPPPEPEAGLVPAPDRMPSLQRTAGASMKVALLGPYPVQATPSAGGPPLPGGVDAVVVSLARGLSRCPGVEVHVITAIPGLTGPREFAENGYTIHATPRPARGRLTGQHQVVANLAAEVERVATRHLPRAHRRGTRAGRAGERSPHGRHPSRHHPPGDGAGVARFIVAYAAAMARRCALRGPRRRGRA